ncbi:MAG TPA: hypothetical protein VNM87_00910 [Candidatus Udaeobacter sp.]|nr:hypothetical protein [Candidatus Udaeobacter sp.]
MDSKPLFATRIGHGTAAPRPARGQWVVRVVMAAIWIALVLGATGCTKRTPVSATETNIADGRTFDIELTGDRRVHGKLTKGSVVRYEQGDSLFDAEVDEVTDEFIEFSRRELVANRSDMTRLARAQEDAAAGVERPELGGALLPRDEIESVSLLSLDRRRIVVETICWTALVLTAGYAGMSD